MMQIRVGGFGGQGVILIGTILGKAGAIFDHKFATMTRSYGPEARGGACSSQVLISDESITFPYVTQPDYLIALSQEIYDKFSPGLAEGACLIYEKDLVKPNGLQAGIKKLGIPCMRFAEELGSRVVLNMVMLGYFSANCPGLTKEAIQEAIRITVPPKTIDVNLMAFEKGYTYDGS
ncbi:MAG: 2-oxoacid:acceptor oxidoreductase family protein [Candidatus Omnitrophica bacterium]|nr:2-oxoacid:acceptor oxidoreductase family protein [Candidatus Omnitrophota bacterium]